MKTMTKVYIDGENFRHGLSSILVSTGTIASSKELEAFPLRALLEDVLSAGGIEVAYYSSRVKLPKGFTPSEEIIERAREINEYNRKWIAQLVAQNIAHIKAGHLKVKSLDPCRKCGQVREVLQEKGVDVRLAVDIIADTGIAKKGSTLVLMSSDSDLISAVAKAREHGMNIIYLCFGGMVNRALSATANETVTISSAKVLKYYKVAQ